MKSSMKHLLALCLLALSLTYSAVLPAQETPVRRRIEQKPDTTAAAAIAAAATNTVQNEEVDPYKEFDLYSFKDAQPHIKDSTALFGHLIGVKYGVGITDVTFSNSLEHKALISPKNIGIYYTYLHTLWGYMPYFGLEVGLEYSELGTKIIEKDDESETTSEIEDRYDCLQLQMLCQFRKDFWKMRVYLNIGPYAYWVKSSQSLDEVPDTTNKLGGGLMGGLGFAYRMNRFEIHLEGNVKYAFNHFYDRKIYSQDAWLYTHSLQISGNIGLFYRFGGIK